MKRAIELAKLGAGSVSTNPMVGAVIVYNDIIIGEGYHKKCGEAHAEINALNSVKQEDLGKLPLSTMFVSLEPCSHWGKTGPCCEAVIEKKIKKIVIAMKDPFTKVCGRGIEMMKKFGVEVEVGIMEQEARELNKRFITFHEKKRPYITLKWAATSDGYIDSNRDITTPAPWITNHACKILVHKYRAEEDAIWVGKNTVIRDNPTLTIREWFGKNPIRISMDNKNTISDIHNICNNEAETIIYRNKSIEQILDDMYSRGIQSVLVEGGKYLLDYLITHELFDEIKEFTSQVSIKDIGDGTVSGVKAPKIFNAKLIEQKEIGSIILKTYYTQSAYKKPISNL